MAVHRNTPTCHYCGKPTDEAIYSPPINSHFIGDTFVGWKSLNHKCKGQTKANNELRKSVESLTQPKNPE